MNPRRLAKRGHFLDPADEALMFSVAVSKHNLADFILKTRVVHEKLKANISPIQPLVIHFLSPDGGMNVPGPHRGNIAGEKNPETSRRNLKIQAFGSLSRYSVGETPVSLRKTRLKCVNDWNPTS